MNWISGIFSRFIQEERRPLGMRHHVKKNIHWLADMPTDQRMGLDEDRGSGCSIPEEEQHKQRGKWKVCSIFLISTPGINTFRYTKKEIENMTSTSENLYSILTL